MTRCLALAAIVTVAGIFQSPAHAQSQTVVGANERIFPTSAGAIYFKLKSDSCNSGNAYYTIAANELALKNWYAMLLAAAETGGTVAVALPGATVCGTTDNKSINYVYRNY